jgi:hypothetical protein
MKKQRLPLLRRQPLSENMLCAYKSLILSLKWLEPCLAYAEIESKLGEVFFEKSVV